MKRLSVAAVVTLLGAVAPVAFAQAPPAATENGAANLALVTVPAKGGAKLTVSSPGFKEGADIPFENTQYKGNVFPGLTWSAGPAGTKAYVLIMQDGDSRAGREGSPSVPIFHWSVVNIPAGTTKLDAGLTAAPAGAAFGPNMRGAAQPYLGPRTPAGPKHRYHFQIFALDIALPAEAGANYAALTAAMKDHVLASGETIGLGQVMIPGR